MSLAKKAYNFLRRIKRKYCKPRVMRRLVSEGKAPTRSRILSENGTALPAVYRISASQGLDGTMQDLERLFRERFSKKIAHRKILVKFNLNTANSYPASVCPQMLRSLVEILLNLDAREVTVGDCCNVRLLPTRKQVKKAGLEQALAGRARIVCFDETPWMTVMVPGCYLTHITVPRPALDAECIIALANLKTHRQAVYTGALKLAVGFMHPLERFPLHREYLQEKVAEINLALQPDLFVMDGRTAMITGGPDHGLTAPGNTLLVGENPVAVDAEAYRLLYSLKKKNNCLEEFTENPFDLLQLSHALEMGIGGSPWNGCRILDW